MTANPKTPSGYSPALAHALSQLCACVYQSVNECSAPPEIPPPYSQVATFSVDKVPWAILYQSPSVLAVAFRGPCVLEEIAPILGITAMTTPSFLQGTDAKVPHSLVQVYESLRPALHASLAKSPRGDFTLHLAGHGFGGALAAMAFLDLKKNLPQSSAPLGSVYSFGSPPAANAEFKDLFREECPTSFQLIAERVVTAT